MKTIYRVSQYAWDKFTDWIRKPDNQMYFMVTVFVIYLQNGIDL